VRARATPDSFVRAGFQKGRRWSHHSPTSGWPVLGPLLSPNGSLEQLNTEYAARSILRGSDPRADMIFGSDSIASSVSADLTYDRHNTARSGGGGTVNGNQALSSNDNVHYAGTHDL